MRVKICDRCGKKDTDGLFGTDIHTIEMGYDNKEFDLCVGCYLKFQNDFMKNRR